MRQTLVFFKAPRWFCVQAGLRGCEGHGGFAPLNALEPLVSTLSSPGFSCPFLWPGTMMGAPCSQKYSLTLRGHTTKSRQTPRCQTSLLCNFEAQDTAFLECLDNKRSAYTPLTSADFAPQIYFPEGGEWTQQSLNKPVFKENSTHTHFHFNEPINLWANTALIWNEMQKPDAGK